MLHTTNMYLFFKAYIYIYLSKHFYICIEPFSSHFDDHFKFLYTFFLLPYELNFTTMCLVCLSALLRSVRGILFARLTIYTHIYDRFSRLGSLKNIVIYENWHTSHLGNVNRYMTAKVNRFINIFLS